MDISGQGWRVLSGSCLDRLPELEDASIDAVVCDPPYELGFMGKSWDSSGIAYNVDVWRECLRVLKPGGHLLAFGGTRTWHRIAVAIEDAGFDIRDSIAWLYGSGFPKSLDVSKAIDKSTGENRARQLRFTEWMRSTGVTARQIDEATGTNMGSHYLSSASQPSIATADLFDAMRHLLPEVPEEIERLVAERTGIEWTAYKNREVIGQTTKARSTSGSSALPTVGGGTVYKTWDETAPATPDAQKWQGWGTALKPAFEPVIVARKPLIGTVAENVLTHGTGALNIDAARIGTGTGETRTVFYPDIRGDNYQQGKEAYSERGTVERVVKDQGRWPSNVMLDEVTAALVDEQSGERASGGGAKGIGGMFGNGGYNPNRANTLYFDTGGASRFFYVSKASKRDRNEGLDGLEERMARKFAQDETTLATMPFGKLPVKNFHPTVKPTDLMRQLVRLVTPPGGVVLDPFTGSGSTGKAAILEGFEFIGCELTDDYLPIIEGRLNHAVGMVEELAAEAKAREAETLF